MATIQVHLLVDLFQERTFGYDWNGDYTYAAIDYRSAKGKLSSDPIPLNVTSGLNLAIFTSSPGGRIWEGWLAVAKAPCIGGVESVIELLDCAS